MNLGIEGFLELALPFLAQNAVQFEAASEREDS
jgi:hypothetical protein